MAKKNKVVIDVEANTSKLDAALEASENAVGNLGKTGKTAVGTLDRLTGGFASRIVESVAGVRQLIGGLNATKVAIAATGIGVFVVALGSLVTYFTKTADGAKLLERGMAMLTATFNVILDRVAMVGKAIVQFFSGDFQAALDTAKSAVQGIGAEIKNEVAAMDALTLAAQRLRAAQREIIVETAKQRAEIERLKMASDDVNRSTEQRIKDATRAAELERNLLKQRENAAAEELRIAREKEKMSNSTEDDLMRLAELEAELYGIRQESTTLQTELQNKVNSLRAEAAAKEAERQKAEQEARDAQIQAELDAAQKRADALIAIENAVFDATATSIEKEVKAIEDKYNTLEALAIANGISTLEIEAARIAEIEALEERQRVAKAEADKKAAEDKAKLDEEATKKAQEEADKQAAADKALYESRKAIAGNTMQAIAALADAFTKGDETRAKRNFAINKAIGITNAVISTAEGITAALTDKTQPSTILRILQTASVAAIGAAQIATIAKQKFQVGDTPPPPSVGGTGGGASVTAPQIDLSFMGQASSQTGIRSYVLASEVSNAQQANQRIKDQSTLFG